MFAHLRRFFLIAAQLVLVASLTFNLPGIAAPEGAAIQPGVPNLFLDLPETASGEQPAPPPPSPASIRERLARVDMAALADPNRNQALRLNLFDDLAITAERARAGIAYENGFIWSGKVAGNAYSTVILVRVNDALAGMVLDGAGQTYEIRYAGGDRHVLRELDTMRFPDEADTPPAAAPPLERPASIPAGAGENVFPLVDDSSRIDYMVIYSDDARVIAGSTDAMLAEVYLAVELTNQAYANSNVVQRLNLVYTGEVSYSESGNSSTDLARLRDPGDGHLDQVPVWRDRYGADLVSLIVKTMESQHCGLGGMMDPIDAGFASNANNILKQECAASNLTMAHELGHNMGGRHDWYIDESVTPYSYAHGYVDVTHRWRTIMAYKNECDDQTPAVSCPRILHFSNPSVNYGGFPTGVASGTDTSCNTGDLGHPDCDADMHRVLNNTRTTVAQFSGASPGRNDAWLKDTWEDTGAEPDPRTAGQDMYKSPFLWVRNGRDAQRVYEHEHQNPLNGVTNYVYSKLLNGSETSMTGTLRLYWAEQAAGLAWPVDWHEFASISVTIPANSSQVLEATWVPSGTGHYCLLARWDSTADPMHAAEGIGVGGNVRSNNNIIWKNVEVLAFDAPDCEKERPIPLIVRNVGNLAGKEIDQLDLLFLPQVGAPPNWLGYFDYLEVAPGVLMDRFQGMEGFEKVSATRLRLVDPKGGALRGIAMKYREAQTIHIYAKLSCKNFPAALTQFGLDVKQIALGDQAPVGGVVYVVRMQPSPGNLIFVTGHKFFDRDRDGSWDEDGSEQPLAGWVIRADNLKGTLHFSAVTDADGLYRLALPSDIYLVSEVQKPLWLQSAPRAKTYRLDLSQAPLGSSVYEIDFGNHNLLWNVYLPVLWH